MSLARPRTYQALQRGFTPKNLPGLSLWLDAAYGLLQERSSPATPAVADTDPVGTWLDRSGKNNHAIAQTADANRPILKLNIINGHPVLRFDGSSDRMQTIGYFALNSGTGAGAMFVVAQSSDTTQRGVFGCRDGAGGWGFRISTGGGSFLYFHIGHTTNTSLTGDMTSFRLITVKSDGLFKSLSVNDGDRTTVTMSGQSASTTLGTTIGDEGTSTGSGFFLGDIAEVVACEKTVSDELMAKVKRYFGRKYGIF